eukprot:850812-Amorphochlora_amoeboformis.AAC.1
MFQVSVSLRWYGGLERVVIDVEVNLKAPRRLRRDASLARTSETRDRPPPGHQDNTKSNPWNP